mgnify:CR=1 FL=1
MRTGAGPGCAPLPRAPGRERQELAHHREPLREHGPGRVRDLWRHSDIEASSDEGLSVEPPSTRLPTIAARVAETADRVLQSVGIYQQQLHVLGEMGHTIACDISRSVDELGYDPQVELHEGMLRSIRWCLENGLEL